MLLLATLIAACGGGGTSTSSGGAKFPKTMELKDGDVVPILANS